MKYTLIDEAVETQISEAPGKWLVLDQHPDVDGHWVVEGFTHTYLFDLSHYLGHYRVIAPSGMGAFLEAASAAGYLVAFFEDPTTILDGYAHLNAEPEVEVNSTFPNTVKGMLPYQVQGYNMLKSLDYGVARWDTGTGKTVGAAALVKYHWERQNFNYCFFVVKAHNKANTARKLLHHVGLEAHVVKGPKSQRARTYLRATEGPYSSRMRILVLNYEQFKSDFVIWGEVTNKKKEKVKKITGLTEWGEAFFPNQELLIVWDEMPTKLKTRTTQLYKSICYCLYRTDPPKVNWNLLRPKSVRSYMLSGTPIENSPEDWFNCVRMMDGGQTYGTVSDFNNEYVASWNYFDDNKPETFHNLEKMRLKAAPFLHQVNKTDPDIANVFPKAVEEQVYIDWDDRNRKLYEGIQKFAKDLADNEEFQDLPVFALLGVLQMVCDAPKMVGDSAAEREAYEAALEAGEEPDPIGSSVALTLIEQFGAEKFVNTNHPKLERLKEVLLERHPDSQVALYTRWNRALMPYLEEALSDWGVSYVRYDGTANQKQRAQDTFQAGGVRVFLSSDAGSDSIDLDAGNVVIDYDLPWKWTTLTQRHNRVHRATSTHETVYYYSLLMEDSVEQRVLQVIQKKQGYHQELFDAAGGDYSASARLTKDDLLYLLTGR